MRPIILYLTTLYLLFLFLLRYICNKNDEVRNRLNDDKDFFKNQLNSHIWNKTYDWTGATDPEYLEYKMAVNRASIKSCNNTVNTTHDAVKSKKVIGNNGNNIAKCINSNKRCSNDNTDKMPSSKRVKNDMITPSDKPARNKLNVNADKIIKKTDYVSQIQNEYKTLQMEAYKTAIGDTLGNKVRYENN